ncbi:MAG: cyclic nucleotide-binding domain-containing protein [Elusimicrobia bacterium]|nr:cyclic nucleotide-binding domain-containing protein [Elusimicrobiota bacterium]
MLKLLRRFFIDANFAKKKAFLKSLSLFQDLSGRDIGHILAALHTKVYHEGEVLFVEGDPGQALFIIESGRVELSKIDPQGRQQRLITLGPGDFFGEMALLEQLPRSASATSLEKSTIHLLNRRKMEDLLHHHPLIGVSIMRHLAQLLSARLRRASQSLVAGETLGSQSRAAAL